uniref:Uncharacterized protein n=1 Tax=Candidatus Kentrum sp. SD TaxID=2126332 RepID=A0A451BNB6_9GAMM|nr:MAG: hypothetical protein BECKSD772D_GA0070982_10628 [Candidatus Kentron sp. SD]
MDFRDISEPGFNVEYREYGLFRPTLEIPFDGIVPRQRNLEQNDQDYRFIFRYARNLFLFCWDPERTGSFPTVERQQDAG